MEGAEVCFVSFENELKNPEDVYVIEYCTDFDDWHGVRVDL